MTTDLYEHAASDWLYPDDLEPPQAYKIVSLEEMEDDFKEAGGKKLIINVTNISSGQHCKFTPNKQAVSKLIGRLSANAEVWPDLSMVLGRSEKPTYQRKHSVVVLFAGGEPAYKASSFGKEEKNADQSPLTENEIPF